MDKIFIKDLVINTYIGIYDHELTTQQPVILDIELFLDASHNKIQDSINNTLDYEKLIDFIKLYCKENRFNLIETLADKLAENILECFETNTIELTLTKPQASVYTSKIGIKITRSK